MSCRRHRCEERFLASHISWETYWHPRTRYYRRRWRNSVMEVVIRLFWRGASYWWRGFWLRLRSAAESGAGQTSRKRHSERIDFVEGMQEVARSCMARREDCHPYRRVVRLSKSHAFVEVTHRVPASLSRQSACIQGSATNEGNFYGSRSNRRIRRSRKFC